MTGVPSTRTALVLSGGGAKGAFEAGVIDGLLAGGVTFDVLSGTSAGGLNAAALAVGLPSSAIIDLWSGLESRDVYRLRRDIHRLLRPVHLLAHPDRLLGLGPHTTSEHLLDSIGWTWLFDLSPLRRRLVELVGGEVLPVQDDVVLSLSCIDAGTGELVRFANREPPPGRGDDKVVVTQLTVDHLLATAAIPGLFQPIEIDGVHLWDGGLIANTPLTGAVAYEPDEVFVVASGAVDREESAPRSLGQVVSSMVDHVLRYALLKDVDHTETVNDLVGHAPEATKHRHIAITTIVPTTERSGIGQLMDFEPARARELIDAGREAATRSLASVSSPEGSRRGTEGARG